MQIDRERQQIPPVFCWTKLGVESGQSLEEIVLRKEFERRAGGGTFCWGIGNALGEAPLRARNAQDGSLDVLFTPMKSAPKREDAAPSMILLWLTFQDDTGQERPLPEHMVVTSRGTNPSGDLKHRHYALMCEADTPLELRRGETLDASRIRNFSSSKAVGPSQVTAVVRFESSGALVAEKLYTIAFRAKLWRYGFVSLGTPVGISAGRLAEVTAATSVDEWLRGVRDLKAVAWDSVKGQDPQKQLFL